MEKERESESPFETPEGGRSWSRVWLPRIASSVVVALSAIGMARWVWQGTSAFLAIVIFTLFLAIALEPAIRLFERRGMKRGLAAGLVELGGLLAFVGITWVFVSLLVEQFVAIAEQVPEWADAVLAWFNQTFGTAIVLPSSWADFEGLSDNLTQWLGGATGALVGFGSGLAGGLVSAFAIVFLLYYAMADGPKMRRAVLSPLPPDSQRVAAVVWDTAIEKTGGYVYSRLILATVAAVVQSIAFWAIGLENPLALGVFVGLVSQLIPNIGTFIGGALPVLVGLVQDPTLALWVLVVLTVYQQIENYVFVPRVTKETMDLHPAISFSAVIIGANLLGFTGLLLALPATATIQSLIQAYGKRYELVEEGMGASEDSSSG
jgi:predicted PurR-regulated permease PerM